MTDHDDVVRGSSPARWACSRDRIRRSCAAPAARVERLEPLTPTCSCSTSRVAPATRPRSSRRTCGQWWASTSPSSSSSSAPPRLSEAGVRNVLLQEGNAEALPVRRRLLRPRVLPRGAAPHRRSRRGRWRRWPRVPAGWSGRALGPGRARRPTCATPSTSCTVASTRRTVAPSSRPSSSVCCRRVTSSRTARPPSTRAADLDRIHRAVRRRSGRSRAARRARGWTGYRARAVGADDGTLLVAFWTSTVHASWPSA